MNKPTRDSHRSARNADAGPTSRQEGVTNMSEDLPLDTATIAALSASLNPVTLSREREAALRARVLSRARAEGRGKAEDGFVTVQGSEGTWQPVFRGVEMKLLHDHGEAQSFLLRLAPGASLPLHSHASDELCVVLEGTVQLNDQVGVAGTFHLAQAGSRHNAVSSKTGCVLFLRADLRQGVRF